MLRKDTKIPMRLATKQKIPMRRHATIGLKYSDEACYDPKDSDEARPDKTQKMPTGRATIGPKDSSEASYYDRTRRFR